ncbi:4-(cytidine 5'-diphospho)-2-C-methyl-D-erythritol kinase [Pleomorphomonas carboxyditropha]|uniref:4-diphosphocytidyl-2-C-methyl-D-erythritol kinase n=1 Tax=Pleomorphomonas carboxyditropha TaxID=2023338 RepID=A0A2G9X223_9HYPH|nr:4-(cytidine 5'-diphospho)-2-C-methyl-D-erythritol kinase [Pleomorphomonas carboxyditropha]PIP01008.1 4-(cytidine 5'-diphospho)-2-C-methyl-D-erythritol kinase [Pleomorphomonas carboxyditropha]
MPVVEEARAKVNLALHVVGRRPDGYHDLDMLVAFAGIGDTVTLTPGDADRFVIDGPMAGDLRADGDNLVLRALRGFRELDGRTDPLAIGLVKRLPVASGIGGGSADAAATLRGLCRLYGRSLDDPAITALALSLGADVPMCLDGRPARVAGVGERIAPTAGKLAFGLLLVNPRVGVSTPAVFRALGRRDNPPLPALPAFGTGTDLAAFLAAGTRNDLEPPAKAIAPAIADVLAALADLPGVRLARMSGSGATCFGLFDDEADARMAGARLAADHPGWWVEPTEGRF